MTLPEGWFDGFMNYLQAEQNLSPRTVRNYVADLKGNLIQGDPKGFFQYLEMKNLAFPANVDKYVVRGYMAWVLDQGVVKSSVAR